MECRTIRKGKECFFMESAGCSYSDGHCYPVINSCGKCQRQMDFETGRYCLAYPEPVLKWKTGACNLATHIERKIVEEKGKVNPLKASKRAKKGEEA